jgi:hypothetical protein
VLLAHGRAECESSGIYMSSEIVEEIEDRWSEIEKGMRGGEVEAQFSPCKARAMQAHDTYWRSILSLTLHSSHSGEKRT